MINSNLRSQNLAWQNRINQLSRLAQSEYPVLIQGESGTGKDIIAREIHQLSKRAAHNYISVNCAAIHESLVESELFGHKRGAYTGADGHRAGAFQAANSGTLFLDEIGDLSLAVQAKLLRAIENKEIKSVGSDHITTVDVRIISASQKILQKLIEKNLFRQDLFYRLNVIQVDVPSLCERSEDIPDLIANLAKEHDITFSEQAQNVLKEYHWPGNIRELKNFVLRASAIHPNQSLGPSEVYCLLNQQPVPPLTNRKILGRDLLRKVEQGMVIERLIANNWNQRRTARELGIPKSTLNDQVRRMGIGKPMKVSSLSQSDLNTRSLPAPDLRPH